MTFCRFCLKESSVPSLIPMPLAPGQEIRIPLGFNCARYLLFTREWPYTKYALKLRDLARDYATARGDG